MSNKCNFTEKESARLAEITENYFDKLCLETITQEDKNKDALIKNLQKSVSLGIIDYTGECMRDKNKNGLINCLDLIVYDIVTTIFQDHKKELIAYDEDAVSEEIFLELVKENYADTILLNGNLNLHSLTGNIIMRMYSLPLNAMKEFSAVMDDFSNKYSYYITVKLC